MCVELVQRGRCIDYRTRSLPWGNPKHRGGIGQGPRWSRDTELARLSIRMQDMNERRHMPIRRQTNQAHGAWRSRPSRQAKWTLEMTVTRATMEDHPDNFRGRYYSCAVVGVEQKHEEAGFHGTSLSRSRLRDPESGPAVVRLSHTLCHESHVPDEALFLASDALRLGWCLTPNTLVSTVISLHLSRSWMEESTADEATRSLFCHPGEHFSSRDAGSKHTRCSCEMGDILHIIGLL